VGIAERDMAKLFRMDTTHTTLGTARERGTGLGLMLCKDLMERNNGSIRLESIPGAGTTVHLTLPRY
jgi:signal transduction histidine kinase